MEKGKRYLIQQYYTGAPSSNPREWECLEVSEFAVKVQDKIRDTAWSFTAATIDKPFWVLKSEIDKLGNTKYRILEELPTKPTEPNLPF